MGLKHCMHILKSGAEPSPLCLQFVQHPDLSTGMLTVRVIV